MIQWLIDGNLNDVYGHYNGQLIDNNKNLWISPGYTGYEDAVYFPCKNYSLVDYYLDLSDTSFTIYAWILIFYSIILNQGRMYFWFLR